MSILGDLASLVSGGAALYGAFQGGGNLHKRLSQTQGYQNLTLQRNAYYRGIQDKVADAKAAGLHPLFALGASSNFTPVPADMGYSDPTEQYRLAAEGIEAVGRGLGGLSRRSAEATIRKTEAEAMKADSEAAKAAQEALAINKQFTAPSGEPWRVGKGSPASVWEDQYAEWGNIPAAQMFFRDWMQHRANRYARQQRRKYGDRPIRDSGRGSVQKGDYYRDSKGVLHIRIR